jgi:hypothetical protein
MINYELSLLIAVLAVVYTQLLTDTNMIFNGVYNRLYRFFKTDQRAREGKPYHPLFMILIYCEKCFAGQVAFWLFIYHNFADYNFLIHLFFVAFTILSAYILNNIIKHIKHE